MALVSMVWSRFIGHKVSTASYEGQTILITAATGGLGLAAAKKLADHKTSTLIITARDEKKGATAKAAIEAHLKALKNPSPSVKIIPLVLEMAEPESIHAFVKALKGHTNHLDHVILNAGLIEMKHALSSSEYEIALQVNTISTVYLSVLLLPFLLASPLTTQPSVAARPHLSFVSSGTAWTTTLKSLRPYTSGTETPLKALSQASAFPPVAMGGVEQYGRTKLLLEYCIRPLAVLPSLLTNPSDPKSEPKVLVTGTCPGMTKSDLGRGFIEGASWPLVKLSDLVMSVICKSTESGSDVYLTSLEQGIEGRGEQWKDDRQFIAEAEVNIRSEEGKKLGEKVWEEMRSIVLKQDRSGTAAGILG